MCHDDVEMALAEHTRRPDGITSGHTGRGLVKKRAWAHGHHDQSIHAFWAPRAVLALEPAGSETSEDVDDDPDRISKIRARHDMRNKLVVTAMAADRRASRVRERELVPQFVGHAPRAAPVYKSGFWTQVACSRQGD